MAVQRQLVTSVLKGVAWKPVWFLWLLWLHAVVHLVRTEEAGPAAVLSSGRVNYKLKLEALARDVTKLIQASCRTADMCTTNTTLHTLNSWIQVKELLYGRRSPEVSDAKRLQVECLAAQADVCTDPAERILVVEQAQMVASEILALDSSAVGGSLNSQFWLRSHAKLHSYARKMPVKYTGTLPNQGALVQSRLQFFEGDTTEGFTFEQVHALINALTSVPANPETTTDAGLTGPASIPIDSVLATDRRGMTIVYKLACTGRHEELGALLKAVSELPDPPQASRYLRSALETRPMALQDAFVLLPQHSNWPVEHGYVLHALVAVTNKGIHSYPSKMLFDNGVATFKASKLFSGMTPIECAAANGQTDTVATLLKAGAQTRTALDIAKMWGHGNAVAAVLEPQRAKGYGKSSGKKKTAGGQDVVEVMALVLLIGMLLLPAWTIVCAVRRWAHKRYQTVSQSVHGSFLAACGVLRDVGLAPVRLVWPEAPKVPAVPTAVPGTSKEPGTSHSRGPSRNTSSRQLGSAASQAGRRAAPQKSASSRSLRRGNTAELEDTLADRTGSVLLRGSSGAAATSSRSVDGTSTGGRTLPRKSKSMGPEMAAALPQAPTSLPSTFGRILKSLSFRISKPAAVDAQQPASASAADPATPAAAAADPAVAAAAPQQAAGKPGQTDGGAPGEGERGRKTVRSGMGSPRNSARSLTRFAVDGDEDGSRSTRSTGSKDASPAPPSVLGRNNRTAARRAPSPSPSPSPRTGLSRNSSRRSPRGSISDLTPGSVSPMPGSSSHPSPRTGSPMRPAGQQDPGSPAAALPLLAPSPPGTDPRAPSPRSRNHIAWSDQQEAFTFDAPVQTVHSEPPPSPPTLTQVGPGAPAAGAHSLPAELGLLPEVVLGRNGGSRGSPVASGASAPAAEALPRQSAVPPPTLKHSPKPSRVLSSNHTDPPAPPPQHTWPSPPPPPPAAVQATEVDPKDFPGLLLPDDPFGLDSPLLASTSPLTSDDLSMTLSASKADPKHPPVRTSEPSFSIFAPHTTWAPVPLPQGPLPAINPVWGNPPPPSTPATPSPFSQPPQPAAAAVPPPPSPFLRPPQPAVPPLSFATAATAVAPAAGGRKSPPMLTEDMLVCPITQELFRDPVFAADGYVYERAAIESWLEGHDTSPMINLPLAHKQVTPAHVIRGAVQDYIATLSAPPSPRRSRS